jgi:hypothetical protein
MLDIGDKGYVRGQSSNSRISKIRICIAVSRLKLFCLTNVN